MKLEGLWAFGKFFYFPQGPCTFVVRMVNLHKVLL